MSGSPASQAVQQAILQALYALFLGGIITAFLVVGLTTFYPPPDLHREQLLELDQREQELWECPGREVDCQPSELEQVELEQLQQQRAELWQQQEAANQDWSSTAGIILIALATGLLSLSLIRWDAAIVLSNGLLLGGLFTMVGGIGLTIAGGEGVARFLVLLLALGLTVGLGLLRFARRSGPALAVGPSDGAVPDAQLAGRVTLLEGRLDDVRRALGG